MANELDKKTLRDLRNLAVDRCREAVMSVGQLVEDDVQRSAILTSVAFDLLRGAACNLVEAGDGTTTEAEEMAQVITQLLHLCGVDVVAEMSKALKNAQS